MSCSCAVVMHFFARRICAHFLLACVLTVAAVAQRQPMDDPRRLEALISYATAPGTGVLIFKVHSEHTGNHLDRQALLKLVDLSTHSATWRTTDDTSWGVFTDVAYGNYEVEVNAVGYLITRK